MGDLLFLADAPAPPTPADDSLPTSRIQVAKLGRFNHPRWGKFHWTAETFSTFVRNFRERSAGRLPIDLDHTPDKGGPTEAAGWITGLEPEGEKLFATVEWTKAAAQKIRDRAYLFISPTFTMTGKGEDGQPCGPKMIGAALTNRPFLERMAVVSLSAEMDGDGFAHEETATFGGKPHSDCDDEELKQRRGKAAHDEDGDEVEKIDAELAKRKGTKDKAGKGKAPPFGKGQKPPFRADAVDDAEASDTRTRMAEQTFTAEQITGLASTFGLAEDASVEEIVTAAQTAQEKAEKAPEPGTMALSTDEVATLRADAAEGKQAAKTLNERDRDDTFTAAMDAGKVGDASRETFNSLWEGNRDGAKAFLDSIPATVPTKAKGSNAQAAGETPEGVDPERYELDTRARAYMAEHKVDYETAIFAVEAETVTA